MTIRTNAARGAAIAAALLATAAPAADFSFTGSFAKDNDKKAYAFTLGSAATVTLTSLGYAGGTNAAGASVARGGFDAVLSIYDSTGAGIDFVDEGGAADTVVGQAADPVWSKSLGAGTYTVFLTQYNNFGPLTLGIGNGFAFDGQPDFRGGFVDFYGNQRDGHWALDIAGADSVATAAVPEPATWALMLTGFGLTGAALRRRARAVTA